MKNNQKGFTLAELLMVVAVIGILVTLSIPIFTGQLEKSRDAVTVSNLRSAYAEAQIAYMTETSSPNVDYDQANDTVTVSGVVAKGKKNNNFSGLAKSLPFSDIMAKCEDMDKDAKTQTEYKVIFTYQKTTGRLAKVSAE